MHLKSTIGLALMCSAVDTMASAHPLHHSYQRHARYAEGRVPISHQSQEPYGSGYNNPYVNYYGPGSVVLNATERAAREPGVTLELAPDAKETATGGPVGGPPGFDGS